MTFLRLRLKAFVLPKVLTSILTGPLEEDALSPMPFKIPAPQMPLPIHPLPSKVLWSGSRSLDHVRVFRERPFRRTAYNIGYFH